MKHILRILLLFFTSIGVFAQTQNFDVVLGSGLYATPSRKPIQNAPFFNGEFEYHHKKWSYSAGIVIAEYWFEKTGSTTSINGVPSRRGSELQSNFIVKYKIIDNDFFTIQTGLGAGLITMGREEEISTSNYGWSTIYVSNTDLGFPFSVEAYTKITKHILVGLKFGSFVFPDYPIIGNNIGFQLRYRF